MFGVGGWCVVDGRTGATSSGPWRRALRAPGRLWSSISWVGSMLRYSISIHSFPTRLNGSPSPRQRRGTVINIQFTNPINLPVLPPMLPSAPPTLFATLPAVLVTLLSPSLALLCACCAVSFALPAVSAAVDAYRRCTRANAWRRATTRETDIMVCVSRGRGDEGVWLEVSMAGMG